MSESSRVAGWLLKEHTSDTQIDDVDQGRVWVDFARVRALVPLISILNKQLPVVGRLEVQQVPRVAAVRVLAKRDQMQIVSLAAHPRNLIMAGGMWLVQKLQKPN